MKIKTFKLLKLVLVVCMFVSLCLAVGCTTSDPRNPVVYNVTFLVEDEVTIEVNKGETISQEDIPNPNKEDYDFLGWYVGDNLFDVLTSRIESDLELTPKYEKVNFSVVFLSETQSTIKVSKGERIPENIIPEISVEQGYVFVGWYKDNLLFDLDSSIYEDVVLTPIVEKYLAINKYNGEQLNLLPDTIQAYLEKSTEEEIAEYLYKYYEYIYAGGAYESGPKPVKLSWRNHLEEESSYTVEVASDVEFNNIEYTATTASNQVEVYNLIPGVHYYRVTSTSGLVSEIDSFENIESIRLVECANIKNMRDEGGYIGEFGTVKYGLVYRSKDVCVADATAKNILVNQLGIKTQIDFRLDVSGLTSPDASISYQQCGIQQYDYLFPNMNAGRPFDATYVEGVKKALLLFADETNYPMVMHCAVGCDRTGTFALLLGGLLGLDYEDLVIDYELSSFFHGRRWRAKINTYNGYYTFDTSDYPDELEAREFNRMYNHIMETYKTADGKFSSAVEKYLMTVVGIGKNEVEAIRTILIEGYTPTYTLEEKIEVNFAGSKKTVSIPDLLGKNLLNIRIDGKEVEFTVSESNGEINVTFYSLVHVGVGEFSIEIVCEECIYHGNCEVKGKKTDPITNGNDFILSLT